MKIKETLESIRNYLREDNTLTVGTDSYGHCHVQADNGNTFTSVKEYYLGNKYVIFEINGDFYCSNETTGKSKIFYRRGIK